jgi:hypothetical protein
MSRVFFFAVTDQRVDRGTLLRSTDSDVSGDCVVDHVVAGGDSTGKGN